MVVRHYLKDEINTRRYFFVKWSMNWLDKYTSWTPERILRHVLYWFAWSLFYILTNYFSNPNIELWKWVAFEMSVLPVKVGCAYTIAYILMPNYLFLKKNIQFLLLVLLCCLFFGFLLYLTYRYWVTPWILNYHASYEEELPSKFLFKAVELLYISGMVAGIKFFQNLIYERRKNNELLQKKTEAELKYLRNQIQPHFLFNTLNNLYGMVLTNDPGSADLLLKLSDVLSYMLYESDDKYVRLTAELENLQNYIEIEKMRYARKLELNFHKKNIPDNLFIAPLLLIPFVENAFKHGPARMDNTSLINISFEVQKNTLFFHIDNTYSSDSKKDTIKSGIGLQNIRKRLELLYPQKYDLKISENGVFSVDLKLTLSSGK